MSIKNEHYCRVCLKVTKNKFEIDETVRQIFAILLIKLDLGINRHPVICQDCMEIAKKCLNFKYTCITTEEIILSYASDKKMIKPNIKVIYEDRKHVQVAFDEDFNMCRFCMTRLQRNNFVSLNALMNESTFEMSGYMTEMDFHAIENPIVCASCRENLIVYFKFVLNCFDIEEKIKAYCGEYGTSRTGEVRLGNVLQFMLTGILEYPDKVCKIEENHVEYVYSEAYSGFIKRDQFDIEDEEMILNENSCRNSKKTNDYDNETNPAVSAVTCLNTREHNNKWHTYQNPIDILETNTYKCSLCTNEYKYKGNFKKHMLLHKNHMDVLEIKMFKCLLCPYESKRKGDLTSHMLVHRDTSEIQTFKCSLCTNEYKYKNSLKKHMLIHLEIKMFKCSLCNYESEQETSLKKHMLVHKDVSEITTFKCALCTYEGRQKSNLKTHILLIHKNMLEVKTFKCVLCTYESKLKSSLKTHMLVHKDVSEIKTFKCSLCPFESKRKPALKTHMLIHKDVSELKMFKCALCTYESKFESRLKAHMLVHKDVSEITMFKCTLCAYEGRRKRNFNRHMLVHKDVSEEKV